MFPTRGHQTDLELPFLPAKHHKKPPGKHGHSGCPHFFRNRHKEEEELLHRLNASVFTSVTNLVFSIGISHGIKYILSDFITCCFLVSSGNHNTTLSFQNVVITPNTNLMGVISHPSPFPSAADNSGSAVPFCGFYSLWTFYMNGVMEPVMSYVWLLSPCFLGSSIANMYQDWTLKFLHFEDCHE